MKARITFPGYPQLNQSGTVFLTREGLKLSTGRNISTMGNQDKMTMMHDGVRDHMSASDMASLWNATIQMIEEELDR
jgi:hypothetical protein